MRYKYVKITNATMCDEIISDLPTQEELIKKIIESKVNCSIGFVSNGIENSYKTVKINSLEKGVLSVLVQSKSSSYRTEIKAEDITSLEITSYESTISIDNESNRYEFLDC